MPLITIPLPGSLSSLSRNLSWLQMWCALHWRTSNKDRLPLRSKGNSEFLNAVVRPEGGKGGERLGKVIVLFPPRIDWILLITDPKDSPWAGGDEQLWIHISNDPWYYHLVSWYQTVQQCNPDPSPCSEKEKHDGHTVHIRKHIKFLLARFCTGWGYRDGFCERLLEPSWLSGRANAS